MQGGRDFTKRFCTEVKNAQQNERIKAETCRKNAARLFLQTYLYIGMEACFLPVLKFEEKFFKSIRYFFDITHIMTANDRAIHIAAFQKRLTEVSHEI